MIVWKDDKQEFCICNKDGKPKDFKNDYEIIKFLKSNDMTDKDICGVYVTDNNGFLCHNISMWAIMNYSSIEHDLANYVEPQKLIVGNIYKVRPSVTFEDLRELFCDELATEINKHRYCEVTRVEEDGSGVCYFKEVGCGVNLHKSKLAPVESKSNNVEVGE